MSVTVPYADVVRMLDNCATGYNIRRTTHGKRVEYNGKVYLNLPKHDNLFIFEIRKMVRHLGINQACARSFGCY